MQSPHVLRSYSWRTFQHETHDAAIGAYRDRLTQAQEPPQIFAMAYLASLLGAFTVRDGKATPLVSSTFGNGRDGHQGQIEAKRTVEGGL